MDEEPDYVSDCIQLVDSLGLDDVVTFAGRVPVSDWYKKLDVVVLTSISEGQPLAIMEANCAGVPCVATDVGACSELLNGITQDDAALGPSGIITPIANPRASANAIIELLENAPLRKKMGEAGMERIQRFYDEDDVSFAYLDLYRKYLT